MPVYHKPSGMTKIMNKALGFLASVGFTPGRMITLEVKGRTSGQVRSTVVNSVEYEGGRYLVSPRGESEWVRNVRADGGQAVIRHGKRKVVRLEEMPAGETAVIIQKYLKENAMATKGHFGIDPKSDIAEFERIAALHPVFRIEQPS